MNRFRILHLRASNFVGGPEQQLLRNAEGERNGWWEILLGIFLGSGEGEEFLRAARSRGVEAVSLPARPLRSSLSSLTRTLGERQVSLLCTHGYKADILGVLAGRITGIPVACFLRGWTGEDLKVRLYEAADRFSLRFADRIVCLSQTQARKLGERAGVEGKIRIVSNAIDVPRSHGQLRLRARKSLRERFSLPLESVVVATAGRLSPEKGVANFLEAASHTGKEFPSARFLVFGDGPLRAELERMAHQLSVDKQVSFVGFHPDLRSLLPGIDVVVNPSLSEEMPNIVLESMAAAVPVVATAVGGVEEIAGEEKALCLLTPGNSRELSQSICTLLRDPSRAQMLAQKGRRRVEESFSLAKQQQQLHSLYCEFCPPDSPIAPAVRSSRILSSARRSSPFPLLSVVIPVRNEELHIGRVLDELRAQEYPQDRFEILVVDGNSVDGTKEVVKDFAKRSPISVRWLENPAQLSSAGRNVGVRNAIGEFILFIDGHCHIPSQTLLRDTAELFEQTGADCLCRPQPLGIKGNTTFQDVVAHARATSLGHGIGSTIYSTNREGPVNPSSSGALYRRSVFDYLGLYDEKFDAAEDVEFNHRVFQAGLLSYTSPKLSTLYRPRPDLKTLWKQMTRYGRGRVRLVRKHSDAFTFGQILPALFLAWLGIGAVMSFFSKEAALVYVLVAAVYLSTVLAFSFWLSLRYGWRHLLWGPPVYVTIHLGLGAGSLAEFALGPPKPGLRGALRQDRKDGNLRTAKQP
jgi:succinoglycan biosynthesis protein ExoA